MNKNHYISTHCVFVCLYKGLGKTSPFILTKEFGSLNKVTYICNNKNNQKHDANTSTTKRLIELLFRLRYG